LPTPLLSLPRSNLGTPLAAGTNVMELVIITDVRPRSNTPLPSLPRRGVWCACHGRQRKVSTRQPESGDCDSTAVLIVIYKRESTVDLQYSAELGLRRFRAAASSTTLSQKKWDLDTQYASFEVDLLMPAPGFEHLWAGPTLYQVKQPINLHSLLGLNPFPSFPSCHSFTSGYQPWNILPDLTTRLPHDQGLIESTAITAGTSRIESLHEILLLQLFSVILRQSWAHATQHVKLHITGQWPVEQ
jgi:hypothetical protein